jgi:hypothetical protein
MNVYIKTDKFFKECCYFTEGKPYLVKEQDGFLVTIDDDDIDQTLVYMKDDAHTYSDWYFCDEQGNKL